MPRAKLADAEQVTDTVSIPVQRGKGPAMKRKTKDTMEKNIFLQYGGSEWSVDDLEEKAIAAYVAEGHRRGRINKLTVYLKPEERKIYYVVNDKTTGSTDFE